MISVEVTAAPVRRPRAAAQPAIRAGVLLALVLWLGVAPQALVNYESGQRLIDGIQLLQDASDPTAYYYIPRFPRLATREDGAFEFVCLKYVGGTTETNGGLFHALVEFTLPQDVVDGLEKKLKQLVPNGRIVGPVDLRQALNDGEEGVGSFQLVSATLTDATKGGFARSVVSSGRAPLMPGSKAVVAALLNEQGATLLWDSLSGPTSDVSIAIHAYYEAAVKAYNAKVTAKVDSVYTHFSRLSSFQEGFTRRQVRTLVDELQRNGDLKVDVLDRSAGLGIKSDDMTGILQVVTDKLVELMFDYKGGWSATPEREVAIEANQIPGRQKRGILSSIFGGAQNTKYFSDDQYVLKRRSDIASNSFTLTLGKTTTVKVPVDTAGNLGGLYAELKSDPRYFRIVDMRDPAFEFRPVHFQVDGDYVDSFQDSVNFVSVNFRKSYQARPAFTKALTFTHADIKAGKTVQDVSFPRLGAEAADWIDYEYQVRWSLRDGGTVSVPPSDGAWVKARDAAIALTPPFEKRVVIVDADRSLFGPNGIVTAVVEIGTLLGGKPRLQRKAVLRAADADATTSLAVYRDRGADTIVRVTWHGKSGKVEGRAEVLGSGYLYLTPPDLNKPGGGRP
jgi:hypothetical protein